MHGWEKVMPNDEIKETVQKLKIAWAELKSHLKWQRSTVTVWRDGIRNVGEGWAGLGWKQQKGEQTHKQMADRAANASHCWWKSMNDITETVIKDVTEDNSHGRGSELTGLSDSHGVTLSDGHQLHLLFQQGIWGMEVLYVSWGYYMTVLFSMGEKREGEKVGDYLKYPSRGSWQQLFSMASLAFTRWALLFRDKDLSSNMLPLKEWLQRDKRHHQRMTAF